MISPPPAQLVSRWEPGKAPPGLVCAAVPWTDLCPVQGFRWDTPTGPYSGWTRVRAMVTGSRLGRGFYCPQHHGLQAPLSVRVPMAKTGSLSYVVLFESQESFTTGLMIRNFIGVDDSTSTGHAVAFIRYENPYWELVCRDAGGVERKARVTGIFNANTPGRYVLLAGTVQAGNGTARVATFYVYVYDPATKTWQGGTGTVSFTGLWSSLTEPLRVGISNGLVISADSQTRSCRGHILLAEVWNRALGAGEILSRFRDPWAIWRKPVALVDYTGWDMTGLGAGLTSDMEFGVVRGPETFS